MTENAAPLLVTSFMSLPNELILEIFDQLGEGTSALTSTILEAARSEYCICRGQKPGLCARQTSNTLDAYHVRSLNKFGRLCPESVLRCIKTMRASQSSLKLLTIPPYRPVGYCDDVKPRHTATGTAETQSGAQSQPPDEGAQQGEAVSTSQEATTNQGGSGSSRDSLSESSGPSEQGGSAGSDHAGYSQSLSDESDDVESDNDHSSGSTGSSSDDDDEEGEGSIGSSDEDDGDLSESQSESENGLLVDQRPSETWMAGAIFTLVSKASNLKTIRFHVKYWPQLHVIQDLASSIGARPKRLQFSAARWIDLKEAGLAFCRALASKVEHLQLTEDVQDRLGAEFGSFEPVNITPSASLYTTVMHSAASTLRHLEIEVCRAQLHQGDFTNGRFDVLEALFVRFISPDLVLTARFRNLGTRCQMPSLRVLNVPACLLHLIEAKTAVEAGLGLEEQQDSEAVARSLSEWKDLSTLVFYLDPYAVQFDRIGVQDDSNGQLPQKALPELLKHLTSQAEGEGYPICPSLTFVSILNQYPAWWSQDRSKGGELDVEQMPRQQWDWREPVYDPHELDGFVLDHSLANFVVRRMLAFKQNKSCQLKEIRTIGFRIKRAARERLRQTPPGFTFSYLAPIQPQGYGPYNAVNSDIDAESDDSDWVREAEERTLAKKGKRKADELDVV